MGLGDDLHGHWVAVLRPGESLGYFAVRAGVGGHGGKFLSQDADRVFSFVQVGTVPGGANHLDFLLDVGAVVGELVGDVYQLLGHRPADRT